MKKFAFLRAKRVWPGNCTFILLFLDVTNTGGLLLGGALNVTALNNISNDSGFMRADNINLLAGGDLSLQAGTRTRGVSYGNGDIAVVGSNLAAGGNLNLTATGNIVALSGQNFSSQSSSKSSGNLLGGTAKGSGSSTLTQVASNLLGNNVTLDAGRGVTLQASNLGAANDAAIIARGGDIQLLDAHNVNSSWSKSSKTGFGLGGGGDFLSFYGTESKKQTNAQANSAGSQVVTSNNTNIAAGRDVVMVGANVQAGNDLGVSAGRDVNILAGENTTYSNIDKKTQGAGVGALISLEKMDFFAGYQNTDTGKTERASTAQSSVLIAGKDMYVSAGNNINVEAGKFVAGNDLNMAAAKDINLLQGEKAQSASEYKSKLRAGLNLTFEQNATSNAKKTYDSAAKTVDGSQDALGTGSNAAGTVMNAASTVNSSASASLTLGVSGENSNKKTQSSTAVPTEMLAGHDASLAAGNDLNMEGARLVTGNDANLSAGRDINIYAGTSTASASSSSSSFSAGAGIGAQASATGGASYGLTAKAALALAEAKNTAVTRQNAEITAGGKLKTVSGRDSTISGANLLADQVDMRVGRNLRVESVRDISKSSSYSVSAGMQATVGMGATAGGTGSTDGKGNVGYSTSTGSSDYIGRQSSIIGTNGVNIYTEDNTHVKGAVIAALNNNLTLNTGSLSYEDMHGSKKENSLSLGLTGSWKQDSGKAKDAQANTQAGASQSLLKDIIDKQEALNDQWKSFKKETIFAPGAFAIKDSEKEQTARATVGQGTIIVRNDPNADISGLNRDTSKALTENTVRNTDFKLDPLFSYVDKAFSYTGIVLGVPEKIGEGKTFLNDPKRFIKERWEIFLENWGIDSKKQNP